MRKRLIYILLLVLSIIACEEIYNPAISKVGNLMVVEAILVSNQTSNYIHLNHSEGFNAESNNYEPVTGAKVYFVNESEEKIECEETSPGNYLLNFQMQTGEKYYLQIETDEESYKSNWQRVPEKPVIDSIYPEFDNRTIVSGTANSSTDIVTEPGIQIYADMDYHGKLNHYRFSSRRVLQYIGHYDTVIFFPLELPVFFWKSYYPTGIFNVAGPPGFSTVKDIKKHRLDFFEKEINKYIPDTLAFAGWIYFVYQYGINEDTYNYYADLNSQLDARGRIFDPVYIQANGNITCTSSPDKVVLGNFEISSFSEKRYYLLYNKKTAEIKVFKSIPYFYKIPEWGLIKDVAPEFWVTTSRTYPNE